MGFEDDIFNMKFTAKQFARESKRMEKEASKCKKQAAKYIDAGNADGARVNAEGAIRWHNQATQYLRMSHRIEAVTARLNQAVRMNQVGETLKKVVSSAQSGLKSLDTAKVSASMDKFEQVMETMEVSAMTMDESIDRGMVEMAPQEDVEALLKDIATEQGLDVGKVLPGVSAQAQTAEAGGDIQARLAALRS
jgi:charged multivesicular body protein 1